MPLSRREYFQAIEKVFIQLRGAPLLLSPADWQLAKRWHEEGVPLPLVEGAIREVFARRQDRVSEGSVRADSQEERSASGERIHRLSYCKGAVERDWRALREIQGPGAGRTVKVGGSDRGDEGAGTLAKRLLALAAKLPLEPSVTETWRGKLLELAESAQIGGEETVESQLQRWDEELLDAVDAAQEAEVEQRLAMEVEEALDRVRSRFSEGELQTLRLRLRRQQLRRRYGLPRLSLYS